MHDVSGEYPLGDEQWEGHDDGYLYECAPPVDRLVNWRRDYVNWYPERPQGPASALTLAQSAVASMNLQAVQIGIAPEADEDSVGLIGLPQWMWVVEPSETTWGPISRSASADGASVSATAHVDHVVWDMGDGETVTCTTVGDEYLEEYGDMESPSCGYRYHEDGHYTVTATSYWVIDWEGAGESGTIELQLSDSVDIAMAEIQVLTT